MERLTWVSGSFSAHVLNARLRSEGIDAELRGPVDGPYALTVGDLARVEVYVLRTRWTTRSSWCWRPRSTTPSPRRGSGAVRREPVALGHGVRPSPLSWRRRRRSCCTRASADGSPLRRREADPARRPSPDGRHVPARPAGARPPRADRVTAAARCCRPAPRRR